MRRALANLQPEPLIVGVAERARAAGIQIALLSNSFSLDPYNPYENKGLWTDFFDAVVVSELGIHTTLHSTDPVATVNRLESLLFERLRGVRAMADARAVLRRSGAGYDFLAPPDAG